jgi:uncharacterized membrane protein YkvA (DUF1232 family)
MTRAPHATLNLPALAPILTLMKKASPRKPKPSKPSFPRRTSRKKSKRSIDALTSANALMKAAANVGDPEVTKVVAEAEVIENKARTALRGFFEDIKTMLSMVKDYAARSYREMPFGTIAAAVGALLYFWSPLDLIPDFIPGLGYLDDAGVVAACVRLIRGDILAYRKWKQ